MQSITSQSRKQKNYLFASLEGRDGKSVLFAACFRFVFDTFSIRCRLETFRIVRAIFKDPCRTHLPKKFRRIDLPLFHFRRIGLPLFHFRRIDLPLFYFRRLGRGIMCKIFFCRIHLPLSPQANQPLRLSTRNSKVE
jgi:hypothetical protein